MRVFISWSGARGGAFAEAIKAFLEPVLHADVWYSKSDISKGRYWGVELAKELQTTDFCIVVLTPTSLTSAWVAFEMGAIAARFEEGRVAPILLVGPGPHGGPFDAFQGTEFEETEMRELVSSVNSVRGADAAPPDRISRLFEKFWPELESAFDSLPTDASDDSRLEVAPPPEANAGELLGEVLRQVQDLRHDLRTIERGNESERNSGSRDGDGAIEALADRFADIAMAMNEVVSVAWGPEKVSVVAGEVVPRTRWEGLAERAVSYWPAVKRLDVATPTHEYSFKITATSYTPMMERYLGDAPTDP